MANDKKKAIIKDVERFAKMDRHLVDEKEKAYALVFDSGLARQTVADYSYVSSALIRVYRDGGKVAFNRATPKTIHLLAVGYDEFLRDLDVR